MKRGFQGFADIFDSDPFSIKKDIIPITGQSDTNSQLTADVSNSESRDYITFGSTNPILPTDEEIRIAKKKAIGIPEIEYKNLEKAVQQLFKSKQSLPLEEYEKLTKDFYSDLDLTGRGTASLLLDACLLLEYFERAYTEVLQHSTTHTRSDRAFVIGCGKGRLSTLIIEMARKMGMKEIVFNDLIESHVIKTRELIERVYSQKSIDNVINLGDIRLSFKAGDFAQVSETEDEKSYDVMLAIWFVTSEILDLTSSVHLRKRRVDFFSKIRRLLTPHGIFLEDIPESNQSGFYKWLRLQSYQLLKEYGVLSTDGHENNSEIHSLGLTYIPNKPSHPFHIRHMGYNGGHMDEMASAGLSPVDSVSAVIPTHTNLIGSPDYDTGFPVEFNKWGSISGVKSDINFLLQRFAMSSPNNSANDKLQSHKKKRITLWTPTKI